MSTADCGEGDGAGDGVGDGTGDPAGDGDAAGEADDETETDGIGSADGPVSRAWAGGQPAGMLDLPR